MSLPPEHEFSKYISKQNPEVAKYL